MTDTDHYVWRDPFAEIEAHKELSELGLAKAESAWSYADQWKSMYTDQRATLLALSVISGMLLVTTVVALAV